MIVLNASQHAIGSQTTSLNVVCPSQLIFHVLYSLFPTCSLTSKKVEVRFVLLFFNIFGCAAKT